MIENIFNQLISSYNLNFILSINIISYLIIQLFNKVFVKKGFKILVTIVVSILMGIIYHFVTEIPTEVLLNSAIFAPLAWDWVFKPIFNKLKIDYKDKETIE